MPPLGAVGREPPETARPWALLSAARPPGPVRQGSAAALCLPGGSTPAPLGFQLALMRVDSLRCAHESKA